MSTSTLMAALAHPIRGRLVERLAGGELTVNELASELPVSRSAVSQHLAVLSAAGLVRQQRLGRFRHYGLCPPALAELSSFARGLELSTRAAKRSVKPTAKPAADEIDAIVATLAASWPQYDESSMALLLRISWLTRLVDKLFATAAADHGLSVADATILATLHRLGPPHQCTPTRLSHAGFFSQPVMSKRLPKLARMKLIERCTAPDDGRCSLVKLTAKGMQTIDRIMDQQFGRHYAALQELPIEERRRLVQALRPLTLCLHAALAECSLARTVPAAGTL
jgi:DNA-binding MarR family transcriptional regulator